MSETRFRKYPVHCYDCQNFLELGTPLIKVFLFNSGPDIAFGNTKAWMEFLTKHAGHDIRIGTLPLTG